MNEQIKTPLSHPDHPVIGKYFGGYSYDTKKTEIYFCSAYDPRVDFVLEGVTTPEPERKEVSPRAINGTFWPAYEEGEVWHVWQWRVKVLRSERKRVLKDETINH